MSIIWQYLDKRAAAIKALKDFDSMKYIIDNTSAEIANVHDSMGSLRSPGFDSMPHASNPQAAEDRIIKGIDEIDVLKERYRQAVEYMEWFKPAWEALTGDEQYVLETFYREEDYGSGAVYAVCDYFHIERSSAYNKKNRALDHLTTLLYGKS